MEDPPLRESIDPAEERGYDTLFEQRCTSEEYESLLCDLRKSCSLVVETAGEGCTPVGTPRQTEGSTCSTKGSRKFSPHVSGRSPHSKAVPFSDRERQSPSTKASRNGSKQRRSLLYQKPAAEASLVRAKLKSVPCSENGHTEPQGNALLETYGAFVRIEVQCLEFKETHTRSSGSVEMITRLTGPDMARIDSITLVLGSEDHTLDCVLRPVFLVAKDALADPSQAHLTVYYDSPHEGRYFVKDHPVLIGAGESACCAIM